MRLKVSTSNFYVGNPHPEQGAHVLASQHCDISGVQEGHSDNAQAIRRALADSHITWWGTSDNKEKAFAELDVPVVYTRKLNVIKRWTRLISHRAQVKNIGMPRAATVVRFKKEGVKVSFINTHTNAAVQGKDPRKQHLSTKIRRVYEYIKGMIVLEAMIRNAKSRGDLVVLVGDLNYRPSRAGIWKFSPIGLFKRTGLHYRNEGLDYIAFSPKFKAGKFDKIPAGPRTGADHPWLFLELTTT